MATIEAFCAEHRIDVDEVIYEWPATKFEGLYRAYSKRKIAEELAQRRMAEIAGTLGNPNLDSKEEPELRENIMKSIADNYDRAIAFLYGGESLQQEEEEEIDYENDPFWKAAKKGIEDHGLDQL